MLMKGKCTVNTLIRNYVFNVPFIVSLLESCSAKFEIFLVLLEFFWGGVKKPSFVPGVELSKLTKASSLKLNRVVSCLLGVLPQQGKRWWALKAGVL